MTLTRRGLLHRLLLVVGLDPIPLLERVGRRAPERAVRISAAGADAESTAGALSADELDDLVAFGEILVEGRALAPPERAYLVDHIRTRIGLDPWSLSLYRGTVQLINRLAGARFATLDVARRTELVTTHRLFPSADEVAEEPGELADQAHQVRTRAARDLIAGYYASPVGWATVGYDVFPGMCGDLARYTRAGT